ncbi:death domain associated protein, partial [Perilla frutescens var. hirtella]
MIGVSGAFPAAAAVSSLLQQRRSIPVPCRCSNNLGNGRSSVVVLVSRGGQDSSASNSISQQQLQQQQRERDDPDPQDLEYVSQIKTVLERLKKNRDMLFNEVKLTVLIEDPRDVERRRLLGIDDENAPTRDDLADALVNEGKIPENRLALQMLAEEMLQWPNLE